MSGPLDYDQLRSTGEPPLKGAMGVGLVVEPNAMQVLSFAC